MTHGFAIAIDGTAGSGKSTLGRRLAARLKLQYVDSGAFYRAVGWKARASGIEFSEVAKIAELARTIDIALTENDEGQKVLVDGEDATRAIRSPEASAAASAVAVIPAVRAAITERLRALVNGGVVMEGRDIGTVVLPHAQIKFFLDASLSVRAARRRTEQAESGINDSPDIVAREIEKRDAMDKNRSAAPLIIAEDAIVIDTGDRSLEELECILLEKIEEAKRGM